MVLCHLGVLWGSLLSGAIAEEAAPSSDGSALARSLRADDECRPGDGRCSLSAVQLSTRRAFNASDADEPQEVRILHISDTHNMHRQIEKHFPFPPADILIHSGDWTNLGKDEEFADANEWLGTLQPRFKHILAIVGNHDWITDVSVETAWTDESFWRQRLSNARLLLSEEASVMGLKIFGSSWKGAMSHGNPHGFGVIPDDLDVLITHGPPWGILDWCGRQHWGSSDELLDDVKKKAPKVHLFGHDHEQRGQWKRDSLEEQWTGGVEYMVNPKTGVPFPTSGPPPADYPCKLISNNAMMNHPGHEGWTPHRIAGPARLIVARKVGGEWSFSTEDHLGASSALEGNVDAGIS